VIITARDGRVGFVTPSLNIGCFIEDNNEFSPQARCDIHERTWTPPPRPPRCDLDWGGGLELNATGLGQFTCASDSAFVAKPVLAYDHGYRVGRFVCTGRAAGVTCKNERTGHGFFISRDKTRVF
jgi:hypothetical protein